MGYVPISLPATLGVMTLALADDRPRGRGITGPAMGYVPIWLPATLA